MDKKLFFQELGRERAVGANQQAQQVNERVSETSGVEPANESVARANKRANGPVLYASIPRSFDLLCAATRGPRVVPRGLISATAEERIVVIAGGTAAVGRGR